MTDPQQMPPPEATAKTLVVAPDTDILMPGWEPVSLAMTDAGNAVVLFRRASLARPPLDVGAHEELERLRIERRLAMNMAERDVQFGDGWLCDYAAQISVLNDTIADRIRSILTDATGGGGERDAC